MVKKNEIVCTFNNTYNKQVRDGIFFHTIRNNHCVMFYVTQSSLKRLFHVARDMSSEREFCCGLSQFHCRNEVKQGHIRYKQTNCRPNYILEKIDNWCRFWKLSCFVLRSSLTQMFTLARRVLIMHLKARIRVLHSRLKKTVWNFPPNVYKTSMYHCGTWDCLN